MSAGIFEPVNGGGADGWGKAVSIPPSYYWIAVSGR